MRTTVWLSASVLGLFVTASVAHGQTSPATEGAAYRLRPGPQLFIDDFLIARAEGVARRVVEPKRFLEGPVITGAGGHLNWQPWLTVIHDPSRPAESRFRVWFDADVLPDPTEGKFKSRLGYLESADGLKWPGPPRILEKTDGLLFGASVLDDGTGFAFADCRPLGEDLLAAPVAWKRPLGELRGKTIRLQFLLREARLYALDAR